MRIRVVLVGVEGAVNLGLIIRTCKNFSVDEVYLVNPRASLEEASRYVAQAEDLLRKTTIVDKLEEALKEVDISVATSAIGFSERDVVRQAVSIDDFVKKVRRGFLGSIAVVFGRESTGLTREEILKTDYLVTIPADPSYPVLNVSQAVAVILWELWKVKGIEAKNVPTRAGREDKEHLLKLIYEVSSTLLGVKQKVDRSMLVWRRIIYRANPSVCEFKILNYWFKKVLRKLSQSS